MSLAPADARYASLKPPTSAALEPALTSSTNSCDAAPGDPGVSSFTRISAAGRAPAATHFSAATPSASYVSEAVPGEPPRWQPTPFRASSDGNAGPASPCGPAGPAGPTAPRAPASPFAPAAPAGP